MNLLSEYALTPDVYDKSSYPSEELADCCLDLLREVLLTDGIVRDLRNGEWRVLFTDPGRVWHRHCKEILKKIIRDGRFRLFPPEIEQAPQTDEDWLEEALATNAITEFSGVITTAANASKYSGNAFVSSIYKLRQAPWWSKRGPSIRLQRKTVEYIKNLRLVFDCSRSLMFIDPFLDPTQNNYSEFSELLRAALQSETVELIEIHRVITEKPRREKTKIVAVDEWKDRFRGKLSHLIPENVRVEVFLWDELHDRYLISNVLGINVPYGFDISRRANALTTWCRLSREDSDDVRVEHELEDERHTIRGQFSI
jgi:hypothetical protein